MNKNEFAKTPPMGWNSYDYYDTTVTEADIRENAEYMANNLKEYGWEYIVVDISWYCHEVGENRELYQYAPFTEMEMDEYARLLPDVKRFPSSKDGKGFGPLAEYIHSLGLKFGIHIMRGIPRLAAHRHSKLLGTDKTADQIADPCNICNWNSYMYGILPERDGAQAYYDSIFELYAEWGVDFVKCDDICRMDMSTAREETKMLHEAIEKTGRPIVFSLSPGPAIPEEAWIYEQTANMWRITDDFWDEWEPLKNMFKRCETWEKHVSQGCYPDCDMLPLGKLGKGFGEERDTRLTKEEQKTMMTLWCIFRSPLMLGANLPMLDEETVALITNPEVLRLLGLPKAASQLYRTDEKAAWQTKDSSNETQYVALFNLKDEVQTITYKYEGKAGVEAVELWEQRKINMKANSLSVEVPKHGVKLIKIS